MSRTTTAVTGLLLSTLVSLVACTGAGTLPGGSPGSSPGGGSASPGSSPSDEEIAHPTGADELVLRVEVGGGLVPPGWILSELPTISIYGDGRVITQGPQIELYPGPALPNLLVSRVSEEGLQRILADARDAGLLGPDGRFDYPGIVDAPTTVFTTNAEGATHVVSAYALGLGEDTSVLSPADAAARADLADFAARLGDLPGWLGSDVISAETPYEFDAIRIYAQRATPVAQDPGPSPSVVDWPLSTPLAAFGDPFRATAEPALRCGVVAGDDLATIRPALASANQLTWWRSGGETWSLILRPLLPDERGCPTE